MPQPHHQPIMVAYVIEIVHQKCFSHHYTLYILPIFFFNFAMGTPKGTPYLPHIKTFPTFILPPPPPSFSCTPTSLPPSLSSFFTYPLPLSSPFQDISPSLKLPIFTIFTTLQPPIFSCFSPLPPVTLPTAGLCRLPFRMHPQGKTTTKTYQETLNRLSNRSVFFS
ncbi:unnamed protein product [Cuscuta epithymum]|uniref:Uncharacterized protein n=1 Tax=Cuscuta epithymum TaxID=186058 RepID=A0AAV0DC85_9ASTE|nr:unnamed protein product [Cuscuta epithymum]